MAEVRQRSKSSIKHDKLPKYNSVEPTQRSSVGALPTASPLTPNESMTGLNNQFGQSVITAKIGSQANELLQIQQNQSRFASVSPHRPDAASYQQGKHPISLSLPTHCPMCVMINQRSYFAI